MCSSFFVEMRNCKKWKFSSSSDEEKASSSCAVAFENSIGLREETFLFAPKIKV